MISERIPEYADAQVMEAMLTSGPPDWEESWLRRALDNPQPSRLARRLGRGVKHSGSGRGVGDLDDRALPGPEARDEDALRLAWS